MLPPNCNKYMGPKHGQPAQRTPFKAFFGDFSVVFDFSWSQLSQHGVPIVLKMLVYEARRRARHVQEHHEHHWDPMLGHFQLN